MKNKLFAVAGAIMLAVAGLAGGALVNGAEAQNNGKAPVILIVDRAKIVSQTKAGKTIPSQAEDVKKNVEKELEARVCPTHELHSKCTTRQAHTHGKPRPPEPTKARARSPAQQVHHASGTHTQGLRNGPSTTKFAHIRYALTSHLSRPVPHAPPQLRFVWESSS